VNDVVNVIMTVVWGSVVVVVEVRLVVVGAEIVVNVWCVKVE